MSSSVTASCRKAFPLQTHGERKNRLFAKACDGFAPLIRRKRAVTRANEQPHTPPIAAARFFHLPDRRFLTNSGIR